MTMTNVPARPNAPEKNETRLARPIAQKPVHERAAAVLQTLANENQMKALQFEATLEECRRQDDRTGVEEYTEAVQIAREMSFGFTRGSEAILEKARQAAEREKAKAAQAQQQKGR